jgi:hypothetical protein
MAAEEETLSTALVTAWETESAAALVASAARWMNPAVAEPTLLVAAVRTQDMKPIAPSSGLLSGGVYLRFVEAWCDDMVKTNSIPGYI